MKPDIHSFKRYLAFLLMFVLVMSNISVTAYADQITSMPDDQVSITREETSSYPENDADILTEDENAGESSAEEAETEPVPFEQSLTVNNMAVTVKAAPGVFPADAALSAESVPAGQQGQADAAVEEVRGKDRNVAVSYTQERLIYALLNFC